MAGLWGLLAIYRSVLLSRGWLITVEAPGHPRHPPSTQLNAVVKRSNFHHDEIMKLMVCALSLRQSQ